MSTDFRALCAELLTDYPITPPPELRCQWQSESPFRVISVEREDYIIDRAAQWGADTELEACVNWLDREGWSGESRHLRAARRPKPPSLKEQALKALERMQDQYPHLGNTKTIRRALEALDD